MNAVIICVGKLKERWQQEGCAEYLKRLSRYGRYEVAEVDDEREGRRILKHIRENDYVICLCINAPAYDSPGLAARMKALVQMGRRIVMVIGGSNGLSGEVLARADERLSFSKLTFPHGLMRVVLLEQLYRAERINAGERYHK